VKQKNTKSNTKSILNLQEEIARQLLQASEIDMRYRRGENNTQSGNIRKETTVKTVVRSGFTSASIIAAVYKINKRQAREHLQKLSKKGLLQKIISTRSVDGAVYVPTRFAAKMAEDLLDVPVYFRKAKHGLEVNQNAICHDSINQFFLLKTLEQTIEYDDAYYYKYLGFVTEKELKRITYKGKYRTLDGMLLEYEPASDTCKKIGIEIEGCFKHPKLRSEILQSYLKLLRHKVYDNISLISHSDDILEDAERINDKLIIDLCNVRRKDGTTVISGQDAALLEAQISYDNSFCDMLTKTFYC
jgi:hypothetical protein